MQNDAVRRFMTGISRIPARPLMVFIKFVQILMLIAGLAAFLYGAYELGRICGFRLRVFRLRAM